MTPEQKLKWAILARVAEWDGSEVPEYPCDNVDELYEAADEADEDAIHEAADELRHSGIDTGIKCDWSRHYESKAVAMKMPDGSWVGWTYWYGGGKHGEPGAVEWMPEAYGVDCAEEEQLVTVRTFTPSD